MAGLAEVIEIQHFQSAPIPEEASYPPLYLVPPLDGGEFDQTPIIYEEEYARSMSALRELGRYLVENEVELDLHEVETSPSPSGAERVAFDNTDSALREMLRTEKDFRGVLDIDDSRQHQIIGGQVCSADGVPMVDIVARGNQKLQQEVLKNRELDSEVIRSSGDLFIAGKADQLKPGQSLFALSMEPKLELNDFKETYNRLGYREGLSYFQYYSRVDDENSEAGSISIDFSDQAAWREVFARRGVEIPENESPNTWIRNTFEREMSPEEAKQYVLDLRSEYYKLRGITGRRYSVTEYLEQNSDMVDNFRENYIPALAVAIYTGKNNERLQGLAGSILQTDLSNMKSHVRQNLLKVSISEDFDDELGRTMDDIIRYAIVEELRKGLPEFVNRPDKQGHGPASLAEHNSARTHTYIPPEAMNQRMAANVESGVKAGRSYGGCASVELANSQDQANSNDPQSAYGGNSTDKKESSGSVSPKINCIKCKVPVDRKEVTKDPKSWRCPHCRYEVDICTGEELNPSEPPSKRRNKAQEQAPVISIMEKIEQAEAEQRERAKQRKLGEIAAAA